MCTIKGHFPKKKQIFKKGNFKPIKDAKFWHFYMYGWRLNLYLYQDLIFPFWYNSHLTTVNIKMLGRGLNIKVAKCPFKISKMF